MNETSIKARSLTTTCTLTATTRLTEHIKWAGLAQVYQYRAQRKHTKTGQPTSQMQYGITSLVPETFSAKDLLKRRREHWTIENEVHWMQDNVLGEDASQARTSNLPHALMNKQKSWLKFCDFSLQRLNSQLNSSGDKS